MVQRFLEAERWLLPTWLQLLDVHWEPQDTEGYLMKVCVQYEYRQGTLTVYPNWLGETDERRRNDVIHEFLHLSVNPLSDYVRNTLDSLLDDAPKFKANVYGVVTQRLEAAVCDLQHLITQKISQ